MLSRPTLRTRARASATNIRPSSVLVSLTLHVCAFMSLAITTLLPQEPPVIEVFQADPFERPSAPDDGMSSRELTARPQVTTPRVAPPPARRAAELSTARVDSKEKPRGLPLVEPPLAAPRALTRQEPLPDASPPPSRADPSVMPPPAAPAVAEPSTASEVAIPPRESAPAPPSAATPDSLSARAPEPPPPAERSSLRPESITPAAPPSSVPAPRAAPPNPVPPVEPARALPPAEAAVPPAPSAKAPLAAAHEIDAAGELPIGPPPSAQPSVNASARVETAPSTVPSPPAPAAVAPPPVRDPGRPLASDSSVDVSADVSAPQRSASASRATTLTPVENAEAKPALAGALALAAGAPPGATAAVSATMPGGLAAAKPGVSAPASSAGANAPVTANVARANGPSEPAGQDSPAKEAIGVARESGTGRPLRQDEAASGQPAPDDAAGPATEVSGNRGAVSAPAHEVRRTLNPPKRSPNAITITAPADGLRLGPDDPPMVLVQGDVEDPSTTLVSLIVNGRRVQVPVADRRFRHVVPVLEPTVRLRAEGTTGDPPGQSSTITVHGALSAAPAFVLVLDAPMPPSSSVDVRATWRSTAARVDIPAYPVALKSVAPGPAMPSAVFYTRNLQSGVYTLAVRHEAGAAVPAAGTLYVLRDGQLSVRTLNTAPVNGPRRVLARLLMPHGVLWDQEDWFTGRSQNAETVTKFRFPDGVSWTERKADLAP